MLDRVLRVVGVVVAVLAVAAPATAQSRDLTRCTIVNAGPAVATVQGSTLSLGNRAIAAVWRLDASAIKPVSIADKLTRHAIPVPEELFTLVLADGITVRASSLKVTGKPRAETLTANPNASRLVERLPGRQIAVDFVGPAGARITWRAILRNGANYLRQQIVVQAGSADLQVKQVVLIDVAMPGAAVVGTAQGSPIAAGNVFLGVEHPMSDSRVESGRAHGVLSRDVPVRAGQTFTVSSVVGVAPEGQMRRAFLQYLERERAHPYRTFLHYNTWYDIGYFPATKYDEKGALDVINTYGQELSVKRGVKLDSFLFDDGWDNPESLWDFNSGFPQGFARVKEAAAKYGAAPGVWMSPWGGYSEPKKIRMVFG
jgi:hypothetical protein